MTRATVASSSPGWISAMPRLPPAGAVLLLGGLLLAPLATAARIVPPAEPNPAQRGGEALPRAATKPGCPEPSFCAGTPLSSTYTAWFLLPQLETLSRLNAQDRLFIAGQRGEWRAPRVGGRALLLRRLLVRQRPGR